MKTTLTLFCAAMLTGAACGGEPAPAGTNVIRLTTITLRDQHDAEHKLVFPQPRVSVLTVADRKGSPQIESWVRSLKERYGEKLLVEGVADVSAVPKLLRAMVRKSFKEKFAHPVMLDWEGTTVRKLNPKADAANIFILAADGVVMFTQHGPADEKKLEQTFKVMDKLFAREKISKPGPPVAASGK